MHLPQETELVRLKLLKGLPDEDEGGGGHIKYHFQTYRSPLSARRVCGNTE